MKAKIQKRDHLVQVRLTADEMDRVRTLMCNTGHVSVSCFLRDMINMKRLAPREEKVRLGDKALRDRLNVLIYQVNKIGVNYNQVAASWQKHAQQVRPDGTPYMDTGWVDARMTQLMRMTESLRDEFAVMLDLVKRYTGISRDQ